MNIVSNYLDSFGCFLIKKYVSYSVKTGFNDPKSSNFRLNNFIIYSDSQSQYFNFKCYILLITHNNLL